MLEVVQGQGVSLCVFTAGEREHPAVLLLHGFPDDHTIWDAQVPALAAAGFFVIAPDLRGFGESDRPTDERAYRLAAVAADLLRVLDHYGVQSARVVGHDWGAATAWKLAIVAPERVERLVVLSVGHPGAGAGVGGAQQRARWWYYLFFLLRGDAESALRRQDWRLLREVLGQEPEPAVQRYIRQLSRPGALTSALSWYRANFNAHAFAATQPLDAPRLHCPVLGVWSSRDGALTEVQMTASERYVAQGLWEYVRVDGAGHWMQRDQPQLLNIMLLKFLTSERPRL